MTIVRLAREVAVDVRNFGAVGDGATDDVAAIQAAINAVSAAGGGVVMVPPGTYRVSTTSIVPASGVSVIGAGVGRTVFQAEGAFQCFYLNATSAAPLTDVTFADFEIDGSLQANAGGYTSAMKGIQVNHNKRVVYRDLYIHDCGATGLGSDYLADSWMIRVVADRNGRLNDGSQAGGAGIGIGTGVWAVENLVVQDCVTRDNGTLGVFWENQSGVQSKGMQLVNHYSSGNHVHGIAECGVDGLQVIGGVSTGNTKSGFASYKGTYAGASGPGINATVRGLDTNGNGEHGIHLDATAGTISGYDLIGVRAWGNGEDGILVANGANPMGGIRVIDCLAEDNQLCGLAVTSAGGVITDMVLDGNMARANGRNTGTTADQRSGFRIAQSINQLRVVNNRAWDDQATKTQQWGLYMTTGTYTGGWMDGNDWCQNAQANNVSIAATFSSYRIGFNNGHTVWTGTPEGAVVAPVGTLFRRLDGGAATTLYVKESGSSNTGWVAK